MMELGVEGMMLSPGYSYDKAPDQSISLGSAQTRKLFQNSFHPQTTGKFNQSPLFLEFLDGQAALQMHAVMPTFNIFGWQKPCYLLQDGYAETFEELIETTEWERYGTESGNRTCELHGSQRLRSHGR